MSWARGLDENGRLAGYSIQAICDEPGCGLLIDRGIDYKCKCCHRYFCEQHREWPDNEDFDTDEFSSELGNGFCVSCAQRLRDEYVVTKRALEASGQNPQEDAELSPYDGMARTEASEWAASVQELFERPSGQETT